MRADQPAYYTDKVSILKDIFGSDRVEVLADTLVVGSRAYLILEDVVILLDPEQYTASVSQKLATHRASPTGAAGSFAEDIQFSFGEEWQQFPEVLAEHSQSFSQYFDLIELPTLRDRRVADLGCGIGRWSYFLRDTCRELILVDFSDAIFVARENLRNCQNALFFMGDITRLPFRNDFADVIICLGVLHHLPTNALEEVRNLKRLAPTLLLYLYYLPDNRPFYFLLLLNAVTGIRRVLSRYRSARLRMGFTWFATIAVYLPLIWLGKLLDLGRLGRYVPLYEAYRGKSLRFIRQDVYDRFFTRIEQRFTRQEIMDLTDSFSQIVVSESAPYWHFVCER